MTASESAAIRLCVHPPRLRNGALAALRLLETCPLVPVDAFVHLVGLRSRISAYQQLARLKRAGLADAQRENLGYLIGERRVGLWKITDEGRKALRARGVQLVAPEASATGHLLKRGAIRRPLRNRDGDLPRLVAAYRVLSWLVAERAAAGRPVDVGSWERPWVREVWCPQQSKALHVTLPAGAALVPRAAQAEPTIVSGQPVTVLLVCDLGTAPVARYQEMLRRLLSLREAQLENGTADPEPELVIVTPDPDRMGRRSAAWVELLDRVARRREQAVFPARVVGWDRVADVANGGHVPGRWQPAVREQLLHLVGTYPFLSVDQLADLLGMTAARVRRMENELIESGWLRRIELDELPDGAMRLGRDECRVLGLVEITILGRRQLASWLGLQPSAATRYHGFIGNARGQAGRRRRLLRALAHTLGANAVFVALALAADQARCHGGTDQLVDWRGAAACERRHCKPDGYGSYMRDAATYGFFMEYDRGTESGRKYAAKFHAYYRYRDSGQAARLRRFPHLAFCDDRSDS